jgi:hypothetical protein
MNTKICTNCQEEKELIHFYQHPSRLKYDTVCKECGRIRCKEWRRKNPEKSRLSDKLSKLKSKQEDPVKHRIRRLLASMHGRYSKKEIIKDLKPEDLMTLYNQQEGKCYYTDVQMKLSSDTERDLYLMSIDRTDSSKGYTKDNVVLCCWGVNVLKGPHSNEQMLQALTVFYTGAKSKSSAI